MPPFVVAYVKWFAIAEESELKLSGWFSIMVLLLRIWNWPITNWITNHCKFALVCVKYIIFNH